MLTFAASIARVRMFLDEVSEKSWLEAEVKRELNFAYHSLVTAITQVFEDYYTKTLAFSLVANKQEYSISDGVPTDLLKIRRIELNYNTAANPNAYIKAMPTDLQIIRDSLTSSGVGTSHAPAYYTYGFSDATKIGFLPIPSIASPNGCKLWYIQEQSDLILPTDTYNIPYPDRYGDIISLAAAAMLLRKGQQEEAVAARYLSESQMLLEKMRQELNDRVADEARMIVDSVGMDMDFSVGL